MPTSEGKAPSSAKPRILVIGDLMMGTSSSHRGADGEGDRTGGRKSAFEPGGSSANQAAWLAFFGAAVNFVARVGLSDVEAQSARLARGRGRDAASRRRSERPRPENSSR